jgi:hypothetical protein
MLIVPLEVDSTVVQLLFDLRVQFGHVRGGGGSGPPIAYNACKYVLI